MFKILCSFSSVLGRSTKNRYISYNRVLFRDNYSAEDKTYILNRINERNIPSKSIGENHAQKILAYVEKNKVGSLEDLLNISGIGPKLLKKICDKILSGTNDDVPITVKKRREFQFVIPPLDEAKRKALRGIVGVQVGIENVAWALVDTATREVLEWKFTENLCEADNLFAPLQMVERIEKLIPAADLYLFEDNGIGRQRPDYCRGYLTAMLLTSFQVLRSRSSEDPVVSIVKASLKNRLYNASVGSERVSIQKHVVEMIEKPSTTTGSLFIPMQLADKFLSFKPTKREDMAQALLLVTSYIRIFIDSLGESQNQQ